MKLSQTIIRFPEIKLKTRDAHKLRGYFGQMFREESELLHNHMGNGEYRYEYPKVQYKVIDRTPFLVGIGEGAELLRELFLKIKELDINGTTYPVHQKNIEGRNRDTGVTEKSQKYQFQTLWMAMNQKNYERYKEADMLEKRELLERILIGNCLSFFKSIDHFVEEKLKVNGSFNEKSTHFKNNRMLAFEGMFTANIHLPDYVGLGKAVSRGFGTVKRVS